MPAMPMDHLAGYAPRGSLNPDPISDQNMSSYIRLYALVVPVKSIPDVDGQNLHPFSDQNGSKSILFGTAHT